VVAWSTTVKEAVRFVVTLLALFVPNLLVLHGSGWLTLPAVTLTFLWASVPCVLTVLLPKRPWRPSVGVSRWVLVGTLAAWLWCAMMLLATEWDMRIVLAILLVLPGLNFLLLESLGLTPYSHAPKRS
jgi:hypothetical protein